MPGHRWHILGLLESDSDAGSVMALADALVGAGGQDRIVPLAVAGDETTQGLPWEPCNGDEMAVRPYHRAQEVIAAVGRRHAAALEGRRGLLGVAGSVTQAIPAQVRLHGSDLLVAARGPVLSGAALAAVIASSQVPAVVAGSSFGGSIRNVGVAVEPSEVDTHLMERALMLAASLDVSLVPVFAVRTGVEGERRAAPAQEVKRFEQMMSQLELPFGAAYATRSTLKPLEVVEGEVIQALRDWATAAEIDLLVVASGRAGRPLLAPGSVAAGLIANCPSAVWIEPAGGSP